jgi:hypothetical protein
MRKRQIKIVAALLRSHFAVFAMVLAGTVGCGMGRAIGRALGHRSLATRVGEMGTRASTEPWLREDSTSSIVNPMEQGGGGADGGRACPLSYRTGPERLAECIDVEMDGMHTVFVVGGLYGNVAALAAVLRRAKAEDAHVVFNGDFNFFDTNPAEWALVNDTIRRGQVGGKNGRIHATAGNVEIEVSDESSDGSCGCAYPMYVGDSTVDRASLIVDELRQTAVSCACIHK